LAWTDGRLVVGRTGEHTGRIHFFRTDNGQVTTSFALDTLSGLATVGNSGRVVFVSKSQVSMLAHDGSVFQNMACEAESISSKAYFAYGPTLLEVGNDGGQGPWRFAVPMRDTSGVEGDENRIVAYLPNEEGGPRCKENTKFLWGPVAPLAWLPRATAVEEFSQLLMVRQGAGKHWVSETVWLNATSTWPEWWSTFEIPEAFDEVLGLAADERNSWMAVRAGARARLFRVSRLEGMGFGPLVASLSPPVLDAYGNAYVVVSEPPGAPYEVRRYLPGAVEGALPDAQGTLSQGGDAPVGSPILGQAVGGKAAEIYVVTTGGKVHAFRADTLAFLWTRTFLGNPLSIEASAQPVLKGNRLWVVGAQGEVRSMVVHSDGLNRLSKWPRMHRDNCNSNSLRAEALPHCY